MTEIKILDVNDMPDKWDAADAFVDDWDYEKFETWAKPRTTLWEPPQVAEADPGENGDGEIQWPDNPLDLFAKFEPPALKPEWLPEPISDYVFDQARLMGTDPAIIALAAIVSCAGCIHDGIKVQPKRHDPTWTESARLWGAIVGDPSVKKSPAISKVISPLRKIDMDLAKEAATKLDNYTLAQKVYKEEEKEYVKKKAKSEES